MPNPNAPGVFRRLARLRSQVRLMRLELNRITNAVADRNGTPAATDLKIQLREARLMLTEFDERLKPLPWHLDVPFGAAIETPGGPNG